MKLCVEEDFYIVYLNKFNLVDIDFSNLDNIEIYFKKILNKIKNKYNIEISGFYLIDIYIDDIYGAVIEIKKEFDDFYEYDNKIEMTVFMHNTKFLYQINDIINFINKGYPIYKYKSKYYLEIPKEKRKEIGRILEFSEIKYISEDIIKYGKKIEI